jgi:DNA-3-methyladenine glycosylase I
MARARAKAGVKERRQALDHRKRCRWAQGGGLEREYHDREWGVPVHDDSKLFELLVLEGAQAGLSWSTILRKRDAYRLAFAGFDPDEVASFNARAVARLLKNPGIIRNRLKVRSAVSNAKAALALSPQWGSLDHFLWQFVNGRPMQNKWKSGDDVPSRTRESDEMSAALRKAGFSFVGSTICYAFMQAVGMVNDHVTECFRWREIKAGVPKKLKE